jgi:hypothetical protein
MIKGEYCMKKYLVFLFVAVSFCSFFSCDCEKEAINKRLQQTNEAINKGLQQTKAIAVEQVPLVAESQLDGGLGGEIDTGVSVDQGTATLKGSKSPTNSGTFYGVLISWEDQYSSEKNDKGMVTNSTKPVSEMGVYGFIKYFEDEDEKTIFVYTDELEGRGKNIRIGDRLKFNAGISEHSDHNGKPMAKDVKKAMAS